MHHAARQHEPNLAAPDPSRRPFRLRRPLLALMGLAAALGAFGPGLAHAATPAPAQTAAPFCAPGIQPAFQFGFLALKQLIGAPMGDPLECEHGNPTNGDTLQKTSTGLAYYRKATNTPTFTDGVDHWALTDAGIVTWTGDSPDPPGVVVPDTTPAAPAFGTRANPIPLQTPADLGDGWTIRVVSVDTNAAAQLTQNSLNQAPPPGFQDVLVTVEATYHGTTPESFSPYRLQAAGTSGVVYTAYDNPCGVLPKPFSDQPVSAGSVVPGQACWTVASGDVPKLLMYDGLLALERGVQEFFALH